MHRWLVAPLVLCVVDAALAGTSATSQSFVRKAATDGMAEVELARIAVDKSDNPKVEQFAQMMVKDHTAADRDLKALAKKEGVTVPSSPTAKQQAEAKALRAKSGHAFDAAYAAQMVKDHQSAVDLFHRASQDQSLDADLRTFAQKTLPTLQFHLQEAKMMNDAVAQR